MNTGEKKEKNWFVRHKILTVLLAIFLLLIVVSASSGNNENSKPEKIKSSESSKVEQPKIAKINEPARDGKFEFTVKGVECGRVSVGTNQYMTKNAQGQFCLLSINVKNIGNEPQSIFSSNQKLLNANNQQFAADDLATSYLSPEGNAWYNNINPGNSVEGVIVFDIPKDQIPTVAQLYDSAFSGGVKVALK